MGALSWELLFLFANCFLLRLPDMESRFARMQSLPWSYVEYFLKLKALHIVFHLLLVESELCIGVAALSVNKQSLCALWLPERGELTNQLWYWQGGVHLQWESSTPQVLCLRRRAVTVREGKFLSKGRKRINEYWWILPALSSLPLHRFSWLSLASGWWMWKATSTSFPHYLRFYSFPLSVVHLFQGLTACKMLKNKYFGLNSQRASISGRL